MVAAAKFVWALACAMAIAAALCTPAARGAAAAPGPSSMPPAADAVDCSSVVYSMSDCLDYVTPFSNVSKPPANCCKTIQDVVKVSPRCLCDGLGDSAAMGIQVDMSRADQLPAACEISVPDAGNSCGAPAGMEASSHLSASPVSSADGPGTAAADHLPTAAPNQAPAPAPSSTSAALSVSLRCISLVISLAAVVVTCFYF